MRKLTWVHALAIVFLSLFLGACNNSTPEALPDARQLLEKAANDIQQISTLRFKLQLTGAPAFIDTGGVISFQAADGTYVKPDRVAAKVSAAVSGLPGQIDIVAVGDDQYMKHTVLTLDKWLKQQFSPGFNADKLIRSEQGIKFALQSLKNLKMVGKTDRFGTQVYHITGTANVADISALTVGLIRGTGEANADIYIRVDNGRVDSIVLVQPETVSKQHPDPTTWTMELYDYNDDSIKIDVPDAEVPAEGSLAPGTIPGANPTAEATAGK